VEQGEVRLGELFQAMRPYLSALGAGATRALELLGPAPVPLMLFAGEICSCRDRHGQTVYLFNDCNVYNLLRHGETDCILLKTVARAKTFMAEVPDLLLLPLLLEGINSHNKEFIFLGNHQCYYRKEESRYEIEYKLNLSHAADIWDLNLRFYELIRDGQLKNYILEYRDEFQKWDYYNHLFEVTAPEEERGYISFIPLTNGKYNVKRKIFKEDALKRIELIDKNIAIDTSFEEFLCSNYKISYKRYPPFRRVRYDINFESLLTGNVFGIFFDRVTIEGQTETLTQCELEYLRTRSLFANTQVRQELDEIYSWLLAQLKLLGLSYQEGFYSKLSFMRDSCS
jgi:hypothetical protein